MRDKATQDYDFECGLSCISIIKANMLRASEYVRSFYNDGIKKLL